MEKIKRNLKEIDYNIEKSLKKSKRDPKEKIQLVGVTKNIEIKNINTAIKYGLKIIGESRVQEFLKKEEKIIEVKKHFIGALQTNKVKDIINKVSLIHSVDRKSLVKKIGSLSKDIPSGKIDVLVQINIGEEKNKSGILKKDLEYLLEDILDYSSINLIGFMTIPPISTGDRARSYYQQLREIKENIANNYKKDFKNITELSMGMSGDYEEAILEGATMVRIGSKIFL